MEKDKKDGIVSKIIRGIAKISLDLKISHDSENNDSIVSGRVLGDIGDVSANLRIPKESVKDSPDDGGEPWG